MLNPIIKYIEWGTLSICEHSDEKECLICLFEHDHERDLEGIIMTTEGHA